jgi:hypothetical protein
VSIITRIGRDYNAARRHILAESSAPDSCPDIDAVVAQLVASSPWRALDGTGYLPDTAAEERLAADMIDPRRWAGGER